MLSFLSNISYIPSQHFPRPVSSIMNKRKHKEKSDTGSKGKGKGNDIGRAKASNNQAKQQEAKRHKTGTTHTDTSKPPSNRAQLDDDDVDECFEDFLGSSAALFPTPPPRPVPAVVPPPVTSPQEKEDDGKLPAEEDTRAHHQHSPPNASLPFSQYDPEHCAVMASLAQSGVAVDDDELQMILTQSSQTLPSSPSSSQALSSPSPAKSVPRAPAENLDPVANLKNLGFSVMHALVLEGEYTY